MGRIVFLLEERSMKTLLEGLLPRLMPRLSFLCITHEGKHDLEKSIPRKLRAWRDPDDLFIVLMDNDGGDCYALKKKLLEMCNGPGCRGALVRIVCQELEAWYFGEPTAMARAFGDNRLKNIANKSRYRDPDGIVNPSREIAKLVPEFQKISGARKMAGCLSREGNISRSFHVMMEGIELLSKKGEEEL